MTTKEIIALLRKGETDFLKIKYFSKFSGIYAIFFIGDDFPLLNDSISKHQIIYIGKTESSQEKRDAKTHFTSGKTGGSTVRKSIGSLLCVQESLKPIPRNDTDYQKGRYSHFKFETDSEEKITNWMKNNLALSFYECPKNKEFIDKLETEIIKELIPILNIDYKNPENQYKYQIKQLRKNCALIAANNSDKNNLINLTSEKTPIQTKSNTSTPGKYTDLWTKHRTAITEKLKNADNKQSIQLNSKDFNNVGNRSNYSFNLEYKNGIVNNNISGSAVARDLAKVLENSTEIKEILKGEHFKIRLDKEFYLWIEKK